MYRIGRAIVILPCLTVGIALAERAFAQDASKEQPLSTELTSSSDAPAAAGVNAAGGAANSAATPGTVTTQTAQVAAPTVLGGASATPASTADETTLNLSAGGSAMAGNTQAYGFTLGGDFKVKRHPHALSGYLFFNYGRANVATTSEETVVTRAADGSEIDRQTQTRTTTLARDTAKNINGRLKYDYFLSELDSLYAALGYRWDPFAGIQRRLELHAGYSRTLFSEYKHRLWTEIGGAAIYTDYRSIQYQPDKRPDSDDDPEFLPFARLFVGYENQLNERLQFIGGVEGLLNLTRPSGTRATADAALRSALSDNLKLEVKAKLLADFDPVVENAKKVDVAGSFSILYTVL